MSEEQKEEKKDDTSGLSHLGSNTDYKYDNPSQEILETFPNKTPERPYDVEFIFPEFTSLCLTGDTLVDIACNESKTPKGVSIKDLVGTEGLLFSFDPERNEPVVRKYSDVRVTRQNADIIRIILDKQKNDGQGHTTFVQSHIDTTPDHLILVRIGWGEYKWIEARDLKEGMRLVADQRTGDCIRGKARHRLIATALLDRALELDEVPHHKDHNHYNNTPSNIAVMNDGDHKRYHRLDQYGYDRTLNVDELVRAYNSGESILEIAKRFGCDHSTIETRIGHLIEKRTQSETLLGKPASLALRKIMAEALDFYEKGYTVFELAEFYDVHATTISEWIKKSGGELRSSLATKQLRNDLTLPALNHRVVRIETLQPQDVYNLEVEDTASFFANGIVVHNCPKTGQPDFAKITVQYKPDKKCIESKSLKLYFFSYRNCGSFMETITNQILTDLVAVCSPEHMIVSGEFNARGGVVINVVAEYQKGK